MIERLRKKQVISEVVLPSKPEELKDRRTLVLDLDETLIYTQFKKPHRYDFEIEVKEEIVRFKTRERLYRHTLAKDLVWILFFFRCLNCMKLSFSRPANESISIGSSQKLIPRKGYPK